MRLFFEESLQVRHFCNTIEIIKGKSRLTSIVLLFKSGVHHLFGYVTQKRVQNITECSIFRIVHLISSSILIKIEEESDIFYEK